MGEITTIIGNLITTFEEINYGIREINYEIGLSHGNDYNEIKDDFEYREKEDS